MPITREKKAQRIREVLQMGDLAIAKMIIELEEKLDGEIPQIKNIISRLKGDKGDTYKLTDKDRKEIAQEARKLLQDEKIATEVANLIDLNVVAKEASKLIPKPKDGKDGKRGEDGKDAKPVDTEKIVKKVSKLASKELKPLIPKELTPAQKADELSGFLLIEDIKNLQEKLNELEKKASGRSTARGVGNIHWGERMMVDDLSGSTDGATKTFYLTREPRGGINKMLLHSSDWPMILRPTVDFTLSGKALTLTSEVDAPSDGATLIVWYVG